MLRFGRSDPTDVFLVTGQSNALSVGGSSFSGSASHLSAADSSIHIWNGSSFDALVNRTNSNPLQPANNNTFGPEAEFAYQYRLANPMKHIYFVKMPVNGTPLANDGSTNNWAPDVSGSLFQVFTSHVQNAVTALINAGLRPVLRAELNMQGETDAGNLGWSNAYEVNKTAYINAVRRLWGDIDTKIILGRVSASSSQTYISTVRTAQTNVAAANSSFVKLVDTDAYTFTGGNIHYDTASIVQMGADMYTAYIS